MFVESGLNETSNKTINVVVSSLCETTGTSIANMMTSKCYKETYLPRRFPH